MKMQLFLLLIIMMVKLVPADINTSDNKEYSREEELYNNLEESFEYVAEKIITKRDNLFTWIKENNYFKVEEKDIFNYACVMTMLVFLRLKRKTMVFGGSGFFAYRSYQKSSEDNKKKLKSIPQSIKTIVQNLYSGE